MGIESKKKTLKESVSEGTWRQADSRLREQEAVEVLHDLFDHVVNKLAGRIDEIRTPENKAISFFSGGREILTINVGRRDLRIYLHPAAGASFDPDAEFAVERFRFWDSSLHKASGKYRGMSFWVSDKQCLSEVKRIIQHIPQTAG